MKETAAELYYNRANARYNRKDMDGAVSDYSRVIEINPALYEAYNNRGNVRLAKGDLDGALSGLNKAVETNPRSAVTYANRGLVYLVLGKTTEANRDFDRCLTMDASLKPLIEKHRNAVKQQQEQAAGSL